MIEKLFIEISAICKRYEEIAKLTGENFNIFQILGLQTSEVRLHSAFLAELLNSKGLHGQGDKFLSLFVKRLDIKPFNTAASEAFVEYYIGPISEDEGGRIDIFIKDIDGKQICIENKIYAGDQNKQLIRYNNFMMKQEKAKTALLYLNLTGDKPSKESIGEKLKEGNDYQIISYKNDILEWLESCLEEVVALPIIRETILQYIHLIKCLTNQTRSKTMSNEIKELLKSNPKYFKSIPEIHIAYEELKNDIYINFFKELGERLKHEDYEVKVDEIGYWVQLHTGEDSKGIYFAFRLVNDRNNKRYDLKKSEFIIEEIQSALFKKYSNILNNEIGILFEKEEPGNRWSLAWYRPNNGIKIENLDVEQYLSFSKQEVVIKFIEPLLVEAKNYFSLFKKVISDSQASE